MQEIPYELLFGVDVAVKKLRPGANFQLEGTHFTEWTCPNNTEPHNRHPVGGNQPHPIMPPFTTVNFIMRIV